MNNFQSVRHVFLGNGSIDDQIQAAFDLSHKLKISINHIPEYGIASYNAAERTVNISIPEDYISIEMYLKSLFFGLFKAISEIGYGEIGE